jgi:nucleotide-binding universal stress UspA family protein
MIEIKRILCPVDFSDFSHRSLDHAAAIARWYEAQLTVLHVLPRMPATEFSPVLATEQDRERACTELRALTAHLPPDVPVALRLQEAPDIHEEILAQAHALDSDLLVIGSHGRSGFARLLLGSVAEKVMHRTPCPTMIVPPRAHDTPVDAPVQFRNVVCAVDFSPVSVHALDYAMTLAEEADARLTVLHVIEVPPELSENPLAEGFDVARIRAAAEARSLRRLRELIPDEVRTFCTVETAVRDGAAYRELLKMAAERQADLIVMGVHGRGAVDLMVFGSNTARVARAATCPVLIVPSK